MVEKIILKGNSRTRGTAEGIAVVTRQPFNFLAAYMRGFMLSQPSPIVGDVKHELFGVDISGKVLVFPYNIGSLSCGVTLLEAIKQGVAPKAIVSAKIETCALSGAIFADLFFDLPLPIVDKLDRSPLEVIDTGDYVRVNADKGIVEVTKKKQSSSD